MTSVPFKSELCDSSIFSAFPGPSTPRPISQVSFLSKGSKLILHYQVLMKSSLNLFFLVLLPFITHDVSRWGLRASPCSAVCSSITIPNKWVHSIRDRSPSKCPVGQKGAFYWPLLPPSPSGWVLRDLYLRPQHSEVWVASPRKARGGSWIQLGSGCLQNRYWSLPPRVCQPALLLPRLQTLWMITSYKLLVGHFA